MSSVAAHWRHLSRRVALSAASVAFGVTGMFLLTAAPASAAAPRWEITSLSRPTNFAPGDASGNDAYLIELTNVGDAPQDATDLTITDTLPTGLTATSVELVNPHAEPHPCTTAPPQCSFPGSYPGNSPLQPEQHLRMVVYVALAPSVKKGTLTNTVTVTGGGAPDASATSTNQISKTPAPFGLQSFAVNARSRDGSPYTQAGGHPYELTTVIDFNTEYNLGVGYSPTEAPKDLIVDLPPGLIGDPQAAPQCTVAEINNEECSEGAQVGTWKPVLEGPADGGGHFGGPIYNLAPRPGHPAELGLRVSVFAVPFITDVGLRTGGDYGLRTTTTGIIHSIAGALESVRLNVWGVPADHAHDPWRLQCVDPNDTENSTGSCPSGAPDLPFLRLPTACSAAPLAFGASADSWLHPGVYPAATTTTLPPTDGCNQLHFEPTIEARPTTDLADSPSGLDVDLHLHQENENPAGLATADLKDAVVTLPQGVSVNPASANGLGACSEAQVGYKPGTAGPFEFTPEAPNCPDAAKIGTVEVDTPLLANPLPGAVYLARQGENPFGSLLAIYLVVDDPISGVIVKLAGKVSPDPVTGQLTTSFEENPQLPFEDFHLHFFGGAQGALRTPATCGAYTSTTELTPWSAPESGPPATPGDEFKISSGANGGACPHNPSEEENKPRFHAGTETPQAGAFSPFSLKLVREDGSQELKGIDTTLPPGLVGRLAGIPYCSDAQLAAAEHNSGAAEKAASSCPLASEVGTVDVGAGAGPDPYYVQGHAYLAGPYRGAPLSLAIVTPAVAGPFDLGDVVVRTALYVNPETAQIHAVSDPIQTILQGIPLDVRSITLKMNRPNFTLNPTSCDELGFTGSALSVFGQSAPLTERFQVGNCAALKFKPKLKLSLKGGTKRAQNPALKAVLTAKPGEANIAAAQVTLPHSEFLDNAHIKTVCTRVQFAASQCPAASIYGHAKAITPLLDAPLEGPVYLRSSSNKLPDLVADLNGQIHVVLDGRVDSVHERLRNTFEAVPDAPVSKFTLEMQGGKKGLLVNSENICKSSPRATVKFTGQNGKSQETNPLLKVRCPKHHKRKHQPRA